MKKKELVVSFMQVVFAAAVSVGLIVVIMLVAHPNATQIPHEVTPAALFSIGVVVTGVFLKRSGQLIHIKPLGIAMGCVTFIAMVAVFFLNPQSPLTFTELFPTVFVAILTAILVNLQSWTTEVSTKS